MYHILVNLIVIIVIRYFINKITMDFTNDDELAKQLQKDEFGGDIGMLSALEESMKNTNVEKIDSKA